MRGDGGGNGVEGVMVEGRGGYTVKIVSWRPLVVVSCEKTYVFNNEIH